MARTRRAWPMRSAIVASMFAWAAPSLATVQYLSTRSGAPFITAHMLPRLGWPCTVSIHLFSELKGISKTLSLSGCAFRDFMAPVPPQTSMLARKMATSVGEPLRTSTPSCILKSEPLFSKPQVAMSMSTSASFLGKTWVPGSRLKTCMPAAGPPGSGTARSWTVISPFVRVPVLSEQKTDTHPNVSTASILRTSTLRFTISADAHIIEIVTVGNKPSGT
mmetsp:Transcript_19926/g.59637  ORF Transcript_19926/g.59637 Transcript_19926/m.59637 type:complete len:220 (-) Transcript_19926:551-1210(-)